MKKMNNKFSLLSFLTVVMLLAAMLMTMISCDNNTPVSNDAKSFKFEVVFADGTSKSYDITSEKATVGEALLDEGLISGEDSQYGLYVMTVCDEYHKYEEDGKYWAFYVNGEYGMTGVDSTNIEDGSTYSFKAE